MSYSALYVNSFDTSSLGLIVTDLSGWLDALTRRERTQELIGRAGLLITHPNASVQPRSVSVTGVLRRTTNALMRSAVLELQERCNRGTVEVAFQDDLTKLFLGRCTQFTFAGRPPKLASAYGDLTVAFSGLDPYIYDAQAQVVSFNNALAGSCPLGTAPTAPLIRLMGNAGGAVVNPVINYTDFRGVIIQSMGFTTSLAAADYLEIDCQTMTVLQSRAGVVTNGISLLTSGDFITLSPEDADYAGAFWPTLAITPALGLGVAMYRKAWL